MVDRVSLEETHKMMSSVAMRAIKKIKDSGQQVDFYKAYKSQHIDMNDKAALCVAYDRFIDIEARERGWKS